ncbi:MAG: nucleotidyltransferase family protein [Caulobacterales bacterium]
MKAAVLLAAGLSTRFTGPNKLLLPFRDRPMIGWAAEAFGLAPVDKRVLVTGRDQSPITQAVSTYCGARFQSVHNETPETGFADSLKMGLAQVATADWTLVLMADMPDVAAPLLQDLFAAAEPDAYAVTPALAGAWGSPVILSAEAAGDAAALQGDRTVWPLLQARRAEVAILPVQSKAIFRDIDWPSDLNGAV